MHFAYETNAVVHLPDGTSRTVHSALFVYLRGTVMEWKRYKRMTGGQTWEDQALPAGVAVDSLDFLTVDRAWGVGPTGDVVKTQTGGRIKRLAPYLGGGTFMLTWGDGVSNVDLHDLLAFHRRHGKLATVTAVRPPARFPSGARRGRPSCAPPSPTC